MQEVTEAVQNMIANILVFAECSSGLNGQLDQTQIQMAFHKHGTAFKTCIDGVNDTNLRETETRPVRGGSIAGNTTETSSLEEMMHSVFLD